MPETFTFWGFVSRWLLSMFVVLATYNPSGYSYFHWIFEGAGGQWLGKILVGIGISIAYATFFRAARRSLGIFGMVVWGTLFAAIEWFLIGFFEPLTTGTVVTMALIVVASVLAIGVSWSYIRSRLSGQLDTNDVTLP